MTIGDINDADQQNNNIGAVYEYDDLERNCMPDSPAYYSNCFKGGARKSLWLNGDILTFEVGYSQHCKTFQVFFSIKKRAVIGCLRAELNAIYVNGNEAIGFTRQNEVYVIKFDMSYLTTNAKKRKLSKTKDKRAKKCKKNLI